MLLVLLVLLMFDANDVVDAIVNVAVIVRKLKF